MSDIYKEFKKYAKLDKKVSDYSLEKYNRSINMSTSTVIEERKTHFREVDVFSRLIMDRIIFLGTEVNADIANIIVAQLLFLESVDNTSHISLYINSPGGEIYSGLSIYDTMQFVKPEIITVCTGLGASMAAILLAGGQKGKRFALKHSRIMIHQPSGGASGQASDVEKSFNQLMEMKKEVNKILADCTGKSVAEIERDSNRDYWMNTQEAKEYGIIDDIFESKKK